MELYKDSIAPGKKYRYRDDQYMAYIDEDPIVDFIIPWLKRVEDWDDLNYTNWSKNDKYKPDKSEIPKPEIPKGLREKIKFYGAMLQLGVPRFIQEDLITGLVKQMYQKKLHECELDLLEITVGRFHSGAVPILDPVMNHLIGTYASRTTADRDSVSRPGWHYDDVRMLEWSTKNAERKDYMEDTTIVPPSLPVLGHSIKNWSGVCFQGGSNRVSHVGYPLNVGVSMKYWRRAPEATILGKRPKDVLDYDDAEEGEELFQGSEDRNEQENGEDDTAEPPLKKPKYGKVDYHYTEKSTYLLNQFPHYYTHEPGVAWPTPGNRDDEDDAGLVVG